MHTQRGFTLIELLVVIAIIGILAGIVLASLGSARSRGGDAAVQGSLRSVFAQAELYASNNNYYYATSNIGTSSCAAGSANSMFSDNVIKNALNGAVSSGGGTVKCNASGGSGNPNFWVVAAQLKSNTSNWWCISSTGSSTMLTNVTSANVLNGTAGNSCL